MLRATPWLSNGYRLYTYVALVRGIMCGMYVHDHCCISFAIMTWIQIISSQSKVAQWLEYLVDSNQGVNIYIKTILIFKISYTLKLEVGQLMVS